MCERLKKGGEETARVWRFEGMERVGEGDNDCGIEGGWREGGRKRLTWIEEERGTW